MESYLLIVFLITLTIFLLIIVWLIKQVKQLKQDYRILADAVARNNKDIAGLCSAAVSVDSRISNNNEQLSQVVEKVSDFEQHEFYEQKPEPEEPSYHDAIQRIREGADADELMFQFGLSRDEATLLVRLHGSQSEQ